MTGMIQVTMIQTRMTIQPAQPAEVIVFSAAAVGIAKVRLFEFGYTGRNLNILR
jgi:hypothetical protein